MTKVLAGRGCWTADMSWPDLNSRRSLEVTGLGWKRVAVSGMLIPSLTHQLCPFDSPGAHKPSV